MSDQVENNVETTDKERADARRVIPITIRIIEDKNKTGRQWKFLVAEVREDKDGIKRLLEPFHLQTDMEPKDRPLKFVVGEDYMVPMIKGKGKAKWWQMATADRYLGLYTRFDIPKSDIPEEEQAKLEKEVILQPFGEGTSKWTKEGLEKFVEEEIIQTVPKPPANDKLESSADLTQAGGNKRSQLAVKSEFEVMDERDEQQILDELKGRMIQEYAYQFYQDGKLVTGIAYAGIKAITVNSGGYEDIGFNVEFDSVADLYRAWFKAKDLKANNVAIGIALQPRLKTLKSGQKMLNPFAYQQAFSKARRNAYRALLDEAPIKIFVKKWLKENKK